MIRRARFVTLGARHFVDYIFNFSESFFSEPHFEASRAIFGMYLMEDTFERCDWCEFYVVGAM